MSIQEGQRVRQALRPRAFVVRCTRRHGEPDPRISHAGATEQRGEAAEIADYFRFRGIVRIAGALTIAMIAGGIVLALRRERRRPPQDLKHVA